MCGKWFGWVFCMTLRLSLAIEWDVFATKTLYEWSHNASRSNLARVENIVVDNHVCQAKHVNLISRHGARNPTVSSIGEIDNLHAKLVSYKQSSKFPELDTWINKYDLSTAGNLVPKGAEEQRDLGSRFGATFHQLLGSNAQHLKFISSSKLRTKASSRAFYAGLMSSVPDIGPFANSVDNSLMRFYDGCTRYETSVSDNASNFQQFDDFNKAADFRNVGNAIEQRLGLNVTLTPDDVYTMYDLCAYETYLFNDTTWCDLMTNAERKVLEYASDLQNYYESMYGNPMNGQVACPLVRDIFHTLDTAVRAANISGSTMTGYLAAKFQFGHSETVGKLLSALGLFRDTSAFLATNMVAMENRKFRSSHVLPYSAIVAFILYSCDAPSNSPPTFYIKLLVNEEAVAIPVCGDKLVCPYEIVRQAYADQIDNCNVQQMCTENTEPIVG